VEEEGEESSLIAAATVVRCSSPCRRSCSGAVAALLRRGTAAVSARDAVAAVKEHLIDGVPLSVEKFEGGSKRERARERRDSELKLCFFLLRLSVTLVRQQSKNDFSSHALVQTSLSLSLARYLSLAAMPPPRRTRDPDLEASSSDEGEGGRTRRREEDEVNVASAAASDSTTSTSTSPSSSSAKSKNAELSREWEARRARFYNVRLVLFTRRPKEWKREMKERGRERKVARNSFLSLFLDRKKNPKNENKKLSNTTTDRLPRGARGGPRAGLAARVRFCFQRRDGARDGVGYCGGGRRRRGRSSRESSGGG